MKTKMKFLQLLCALLLMSSFTLGATKKCARLEVLKDGVITAEENSFVTVPFRLDTTSCPTSDTTRVVISRLYHNRVTDYCKIYKTNENCRITGTGCSCPDEEDLYHLTKTVNRNDSTTWWWSSDNLEENKNLKFDITYPASITSLSLPGELHDPGHGVDAVCIWKNGNPPVTARMLDRHRETLNDSAESGEIRHKFFQVACQDAGLIRCEAPGTSHNKTATLLVRCPPEFVDTPTVDEGGSLKVGVRSHTKTIKACKLTRPHLHDAEAGKPIDCTGNSSFLTGTPPDLTLAVRLDNLRKEEGRWRLELTNDVGTSHIEFILGRHGNLLPSVVEPGPPEFLYTIDGQFVVFSGDDLEMEFPVSAHTTHITACRLVRFSTYGARMKDRTNLNKETTANCSSLNSNLTGTPPDLTLTVRLDNVRKEEEGQWRLELTNDEGTGYFNLFIHVKEKDTKTNVVYVGVGVGVAAIVIVVIVVGVMRCRRRLAMRARYARFQHSRVQEVAFYRRLGEAVLVDGEASVVEDEELYHVIDDSLLGPVVNPRPERPPCRPPATPCLFHVPLPPIPSMAAPPVTSLRRRWSLPANFLHPAASSSERRQTDNSNDSPSNRRRSLPPDYLYLVPDYLTPAEKVPNKRRSRAANDLQPLPILPYARRSLSADYLYPVPTLPYRRRSLPTDYLNPVPMLPYRRRSPTSDYLQPVVTFRYTPDNSRDSCSKESN